MKLDAVVKYQLNRFIASAYWHGGKLENVESPEFSKNPITGLLFACFESGWSCNGFRFTMILRWHPILNGTGQVTGRIQVFAERGIVIFIMPTLT